MRASVATLVIVGAIAALVALGITDHILPAADPRTLSVRPWVAARAMGITAYLMLGLQIVAGLVLSHPRNTSEWRKTKQVFPWHEMLTVFTWAFLALHVVLLSVDEYANVGIVGALVPGLSAYRPIPVALGSIALYALIFTAATAKWTRLLPAGWWLKIHRFGVVVFFVAWTHAVLAGSDGAALTPLYLATGLPILAGTVHRWWTARGRPQRAVPADAVSPDAVPYRRLSPVAVPLEES